MADGSEPIEKTTADLRADIEDHPIAASLVMPSDESGSLIRRFAERYVHDPEGTWWWESLTVAAVFQRYGDSDGLAAIRSYAVRWPDAVLIATDEQPVPDLVLRGPGTSLVDVLGNLRYFEFVLAPVSLDEFVFDTHLSGFFSWVPDDAILMSR